MALKRLLLASYVFLTIFAMAPTMTLAALDSGGGASTWTKVNIKMYISKDRKGTFDKAAIWINCPSGASLAGTSCPASQNYLEYPLTKTSDPTASFPYYVYDVTATRTKSLPSTGWTARLTRQERAESGFTTVVKAYYNIPFLSQSETQIVTFASGKTVGNATKPSGAPKVTETEGAGSTVSPTPTAGQSTAEPDGATVGFTKTDLPKFGLDKTRCPENSTVYTSGLMKGLPCYDAIKTTDQVLTLIKNIIMIFLLPLVGTLFLIMLIIGGILYITSRGNQQQAEKAKKTLTAAIAGLIIVTLSYTIIAIFANVIGGGIS